MIMDYSIHQDVFTGLYYSTLLGGEFANCHGQGSTPDGAVKSLKIRVIQLRNKIMTREEVLYDCPECKEKDSVKMVIKVTRKTNEFTVKKCTACKQNIGLKQLAKSGVQDG